MEVSEVCPSGRPTCTLTVDNHRIRNYISARLDVVLVSCCAAVDRCRALPVCVLNCHGATSFCSLVCE
jgi:hypothetical protein